MPEVTTEEASDSTGRLNAMVTIVVCVLAVFGFALIMSGPPSYLHRFLAAIQTMAYAVVVALFVWLLYEVWRSAKASKGIPVVERIRQYVKSDQRREEGVCLAIVVGVIYTILSLTILRDAGLFWFPHH